MPENQHHTGPGMHIIMRSHGDREDLELPPELTEQLLERAKQEDRDPSELVKDAITEYLEP